MRFWIPPWLLPTCQNTAPTPSATTNAAVKCTVSRNGCRYMFRSSLPHSSRICLQNGAWYRSRDFRAAPPRLNRPPPAFLEPIATPPAPRSFVARSSAARTRLATRSSSSRRISERL